MKDFIFPKLKFITSEKTLQDITKRSSVGYAFLKNYKEMYVQTSHVLDDDLTDEEIWNNAKKIVHNTIKQKRGTVQTELKKAWKGKINIYICFFSGSITNFHLYLYTQICMHKAKRTMVLTKYLYGKHFHLF